MSGNDNLLVARRLAQFCPTSLSMEDLASVSRSPRRKKARDKFIPPASSVVTESTPKATVPRSKTNHRLNFLLDDVSTAGKTETSTQRKKMRYELPNVKQITTSVKYGRPLMVVSLSLANLKDVEEQETKDEENNKTEEK